MLPVAAGDGGPLAPAPTRALLHAVGAQLGALGRDGQLTGELDQSLPLPAYRRLDVPASYHQPKGATGYMVRSLVELAEAW